MKPDIIAPFLGMFGITKLDRSIDIDYKCLLLVEPYGSIIQNLPIFRNQYDKIILINGMEPPFHNNIKDEIIKYSNYIDRIYSYDDDVLEKCSNSDVFCFGSSWIALKSDGSQTESLSDFDENFYKISNKKYKCSFIKSQENRLEGHKLRWGVEEVLKNSKNKNIEFLYPTTRIDTKTPLFIDSMFHICIESSKHNNYFTEKIIDSLISKTIPIYWGCQNINDYFDGGGIFNFQNLEELKLIIDDLTPDIYHQKIESVENNYQIAKDQYAFFWDRINNFLIK